MNAVCLGVKERVNLIKQEIRLTVFTFQEHRKDNFGHYFAFTGYIGGRKIKVVVRSKTFRGQKYFYSVMIAL